MTYIGKEEDEEGRVKKKKKPFSKPKGLFWKVQGSSFWEKKKKYGDLCLLGNEDE